MSESPCAILDQIERRVKFGKVIQPQFLFRSGLFSFRLKIAPH
jgi:hypothetical protein